MKHYTMQAQFTNSTMLAFHNELESLNKSVVYYLLKGRIDDFYKQYGIRIESLIVRMNDIEKKYFVVEGEQIKMEGEGKDAKPVMQEGKTMEDLNKEMIELLKQPVSNII